MEKSFHDKFILYLESLYLFKKDEIEHLVAFAEGHLLALLQSDETPMEDNIYDYLQEDCWNSIDLEHLITADSTAQEQEFISQLMLALKYFKGFIRFNKKADYNALFAKQLRKEKKAKKKLPSPPANQVFPDHTIPEDENTARSEGSVSQVSVTRYERNPENRRKALEKYGYVCKVCGMKFEEEYGEMGREFIEVHHLYPVCQMGEKYEFDPLDEERGLVPLCSNCHSMIHRGGTLKTIDGKQVKVPLTLKALREVYQKRNKNE